MNTMVMKTEMKTGALAGKTALVTGSTSGIGLGIARALAHAGANVVLNGFGDEAEVETARAMLAKAKSPTTRPTSPGPTRWAR
ncbi:MAG: SDR family NAD(P)-dependent oxidoreductase [Rhizomicrobium sp.]